MRFDTAMAPGFPTGYFESRDRFRLMADELHLKHGKLPLTVKGAADQELAIDWAQIGPQRATRSILISSGLHGVEAPLGAAVQFAVLQQLCGNALPADTSVMLLHALNPFGFAARRRFNEQNVDLNRNFLLANEAYAGAPSHAQRFRNILGPRRKPSPFGSTTMRLGYVAARHGMRSLWSTLPVGQYELEDWLFFGGKKLAETGVVLGEHLPMLLGEPDEVIHLDFHTGLGKWAQCDLLLSEAAGHPEAIWWQSVFGSQHVVEATDDARYEVRGGFGPWLQAQFPKTAFHYACAEVGTYSARTVMSALIEEARWTAADPTLTSEHPARRRLAQAFIPKNESWRRRAVKQGLAMVDLAIEHFHAAA